MKCPKCLTNCEETEKFCLVCGAKLEVTCYACGTLILPSHKFCPECGLELKTPERITEKGRKALTERKYITALFVDVTGYTTLAERLDPEDVKDIMARFFREVVDIILAYEGFIDKFAGDAVMALFGIPGSHEDDPIRAIRAAQEIHRAMGSLSLKVQEETGESLSVHIGINTGLVVAGEIRRADGTQHVTGDTLNVASRLCNLAKGGETLVGHTTYAQAEGFFSFERLGPVKVKGRTEPVLAYRVLSSKELPSKTHRVSGLRADLIGRQEEMARLEKAVANLLQGRGSVISVYGEAGTGKTRLIEEFKSTLDLAAIQWHEGHAYAYAQNIPYYLLIDLLNRIFRIEESDRPKKGVREKAERAIKDIVGDGGEVAPYLGEILSIPYRELENINPDAWRAGLQRAFLTFISALVRRAPTIFRLEDLHWADPSSLDILRFLVAASNYPAIFLCIYRPPLNLFSEHQLKEMGERYQEVSLYELSPAETQKMVGSLLKTEEIPSLLQQFIQEKVGGNPFYVEEVVNSLIESGIIVPQDKEWRVLGNIPEQVVPANINGIITARLDRLEAETKELLQEASVIGRTFYYETLESISTLESHIDEHLERLQELDLVRVESTFPDVEYHFKHALIQEAVYNGLLKKQRKDIHERIGRSLERFFRERSLEAWETLAFHFKRGHSVRKAVDYLVKSGGKSLERYALEEANQYYREARDLLLQNRARSKEEDKLLIDLLMQWCAVFYYQGRFEGMTELLLEHVNLAESLDNKAKTGAYYAWLGHAALWQGAKLEDSYRYLRKALALGEETGNRKVIGCACSFLIKTCAELGYLEEADRFEKRTQEFLELYSSNIIFNITYYSGIGYVGWFLGDKDRVYESGKGLLDYGQKVSSRRCLMVGNMLMGFAHYLDLEMDRTIEYYEKVIAQGDPFHAMFTRLLLGMTLAHRRDFERAEELLTLVVQYCEKEQTEYLKTVANMFLGVVLAAQGDLGKGIRLVENVSREFKEYQRKIFYGMAEFLLGTIYLRLLQKSGKRSLSSLFKNLGFLAKNIFVVGKKAERHLTEAREVARETGAKGFLGQPCMQLGALFKIRGRKEKAREYLEEAIRVFEECKFEAHLQQARELLDSLG